MNCKLFLWAGWSLLALVFFFSPRAIADSAIPEDMNATVVFAYFRVGDDGREGAGVSQQDFEDQMAEIADASNGYHVVGLDEMIKAQEKNMPLPPRTIALTFEGTDGSFLRNAFPVLEHHQLPFAIFVSAGLLDQAEKTKEKTLLSWDDLRKIRENKNAVIGLTAYNYVHPDGRGKADLAADINHARARLREELGEEAKYFSYPYGDTTSAYLAVVKQQGFVAAFGQQSGVVGKTISRLNLPRFTMTDEFSGLERFRLTAISLPFPVHDVSPSVSYTVENPPHPGFTVDESVPLSDLKRMRCFAAGMEKLDVQAVSARRFEIRFPVPFDDNKGRLNCTIPVSSLSDDNPDARWRWLGFRFSFPD